ncbi:MULTISPECIES: META domain-containing protein [Fusobacterium]|uniref:META domain-containing protein n=1 Tax=Fusobacterium varium ATCC 27725 TaxID=469618 RepID=A0ABN5JKQ7_FUSVA|nr:MULTISPECIES: META domain-containing protein [Fusobacterium]AVQ31806.1 META domain-containing protein [Fusobacterium varium ATCC 27725]EES63158.2 META domain protein [Fusobacterium varium ATCC 27725]MCF0171542.1 META domain-containing protein [Fusobacterium varium]MCF2672296.1 META domain-containing protein [Fusobacterium varium]MCI6033885.1 META domain-containing protein [Fusobacterium varium]
MYKKIATFLAVGTLLVGCSSIGSGKNNIKNIEKQEFLLTNKYKDANITIAFEGDKVYGFSGVNRYFGGAKIDGDNIEVLNVASTMMAGPEDRMQAESGYIKLLNEADKIEVKNDSIILLTKDNEKLIFEKK